MISNSISIGPGSSFATGLFAGDIAYEAWERMTYGGATPSYYAPFLTLRIEWIEARRWNL